MPKDTTIIPFGECSLEDDEKKQASQRFAIIKPHELAARPDPGWHIKHILPVGELGVIYGKPGSGKTFIVLDMIMSMVRQIQWMEKRVMPNQRILYICAENASNFGKRLLAYEMHHEVHLYLMDNLDIVTEAPNFLHGLQDAEMLAQKVGPRSLIIIDTLARTIAGGEENGSKDMGLCILGCQRLHKLTGATILLIHHAGKTLELGSRGWSGLLGAVDVEMCVEKITGNNHKISITKQKDGEGGQVFGFKLEQIIIGRDDDGDDITSCVVVAHPIAAEKPKETVSGKIESIVIQAIREFESPYVPIGDLITRVAARLVHDPESGRDQRRQKARQSINNMIAKNKLFHSQGLVNII